MKSIQGKPVESVADVYEAARATRHLMHVKHMLFCIILHWVHKRTSDSSIHVGKTCLDGLQYVRYVHLS